MTYYKEFLEVTDGLNELNATSMRIEDILLEVLGCLKDIQAELRAGNSTSGADADDKFRDIAHQISSLGLR